MAADACVAVVHCVPYTPCRVDPQCPARYVPTLYYWDPAGGCGSSIANPLSDDETEEALRVIVAKFVQETAAGKR